MAKLELSSTTYSVQTIYRMFKDANSNVNRRYQRKLVWALEEKQRLIDSMLLEYPIPLLLLAKRSIERDLSYDIIDGLQRIHTVISFVENAFCLSDGRYFDAEQLPRASQAAKDEKFFVNTDESRKLSPSECAELLEYTLPVTIVERADARSIIEIFERINSYGRRLSEQEQRQAGLTSSFSQLVRRLSCEIRGDVSEENVPLSLMPEISVQGVKTVHGYGISAETTFWSKQGVLHFSSLRDSLDEQVVSDVVACILNKDPIQRSKAQLDAIYNPHNKDYQRFESLVHKYGEEDLKRDFLAVFDRIQLTCDVIPNNSLQNIISKGKHHNEISTIFAAIFMAFYELMVIKNMEIFNYVGIVEGLSNIHLATQRKAIDPLQRRANINAIKGAIQDCFVEADVKDIPLGKPLIYTFQNSLKRSRIELPHYEFKQGFVNLNNSRKFQHNVLNDVVATICGMANIEPERDSFIYVGIADKQAVSRRIEALDKLVAAEYEGRFVVGIGREATVLNISLDDYVMKI